MNSKYKFVIACTAACAVSAALTSCKFEEDDYFAEDAALRIENNATDIRNTLMAAENGWVMQYFCGTGSAHFEGFNILARFNADNTVTLASNHRLLRGGNAGKYTESTSLYEMLLEDGPVIAMNTWNDVLTPFVDPVSPWQAPRAIVKDGAGMQGDNNLIVMAYGADEVLLRGERHGGRTRLIPCDRPWKDYLLACDSARGVITSSLVSSYYIAEAEDADMKNAHYITGLNNGGRLRYSERLDDPFKNDSLAAVFTPRGFRLEHEDTIGGSTFQEFYIDADTTCLTTADGKVRIVPCWDKYIVENRNTLWNFDTTQFSEAQKTLWDQLDAEFKKFNKNYSLAAVGLGRSTGSNAVKGLVITFYTNTAKTKTNTAGMTVETTRPQYGQMQISAPEESKMDRNLTSVCGKTDAEQLVNQLVATLLGVYEITPDSYFHPTSCNLQQVGGSARYSLK